VVQLDPGNSPEAATRHGVPLGRNTMCRWAGLAAFWLQPVYRGIHRGLLEQDCLEADETPVDHLDPGRGSTARGYLWAIHRAGGDVLYQWHPSRGHACLEELVAGFRGILQCDGYQAYNAHAAKHPHIILAGCWAHVRRKFFEAFEAGQALAAGPLETIGRLYQIEAPLRLSRAGPAERAAARQLHSRPLVDYFKTQLLTLRAGRMILPKSPLGRAVDYALGQWDKLQVFLTHGEVLIDNNGIENAIRPTAVGKKNWLFVGGEDTGQRSAILYTIIESAKRRGHEPYAYLKDLLERLPAMKARDIDQLLPANWQPESQPARLTTAC
jgi:transposase